MRYTLCLNRPRDRAYSNLCLATYLGGIFCGCILRIHLSMHVHTSKGDQQPGKKCCKVLTTDAHNDIREYSFIGSMYTCIPTLSMGPPHINIECCNKYIQDNCHFPGKNLVFCIIQLAQVKYCPHTIYLYQGHSKRPVGRPILPWSHRLDSRPWDDHPPQTRL